MFKPLIIVIRFVNSGTDLFGCLRLSGQEGIVSVLPVLPQCRFILILVVIVKAQTGVPAKLIVCPLCQDRCRLYLRVFV